ncbi:MAG TPA: hypothetical protein PL169_19915, partial [Leptospiraceae bacterium]|nr:hypothetical protein [Leptospiraceae bacterium]
VFNLLLKVWNNESFAHAGIILIIILSLQSMNSEKKRLRNFHKGASEHHQNLYEQALYVQKTTPKNSIITATDLGIIAYVSERKIIDLVGLGNPEVYHYYADRFGKCIPNESRNLTDIIKKFKINYLLVAKPWDKEFMGGYVDKFKNEIELIDNKGYDLYKVK